MKAPLLPMPGPRIRAILSMVDGCGAAAEIGADHGIIAAHVLHSGLARRMLVTDISAASLDKAKRLFAFHGLDGRADFRVGDGLAPLAGEAFDTIVIAGMGGLTMRNILSRGLPHIGAAALVLQPRPNPPAVRAWLMENGFHLESEAIAREQNRYYIILRAKRGEAAYTPKELLLGPCLLRGRPPEWGAYLAWLKGCLLVQQGAETRRAIAWIEEEIACITPAP